GAATEFQKARGDLETAQRLAAEAEKDLKARSTEIQRLEKALADLFPSIPGDVQKVLAERQARLQALVDAAESARTKTGEAVARATRAEEVLRRLDAARAGAAQEASAAWEPARSVVQEARQRASGLLSLSLPAVPRGALPAELAALREALDQRMAWLDQAAARLDEAQNACQAEQSEALAAARSEVSAVAGGSVSGGMDEILAKAREVQTGVVTEQATIATRLEEAQKRLEERRRLEQGIEQSRKKAAALEEVGRELQANRFPAYLQTQTLTTLAATASRRLLELSQGRYRLVARGEDFLVADAWNADEERSVKTLSGGESFLASLALALALSERMVFLASGGARLDSLFLDEGFGTLDSESLDVVISAIETLQGDGRMVGIITHVPEVAERLPARIEVVKSSHGSTLRVAS
ncbi:MAG: hypothetical protein HY660_07065, partial [Armatimonadetes bacterium]|nr:hypothetical protein [Armatimonadota bacterium]